MSEEHLSLSQGIKRCGISIAQTMLFLLILISGTSSSFSCADCPAWRPPLIRDQVLDPWQIRYHFHKKMFLPCQKKGGELFGTKCIFGLFLHKSCTSCPIWGGKGRAIREETFLGRSSLRFTCPMS